MPTIRWSDRDEWMRIVGASAYSSMDTLWATYDMARLCIENPVRGDFVECGVAAGAQSAVMARAIIDARHCRPGDWRPGDRRVHLYDSFAGVPEPGPEDIEFLEAGHHAGLSAVSLDDVQANMREWGIPDDLLVYHIGDFATTMSFAYTTPQHIALLRMDADLYRSTRLIMEHLYPRVTPGGWVICDDWALRGSRQAVLEHLPTHPSPIYWRK